MIESGDMGYTGEGEAGAAGGTAGAAGGAGESPSPLQGTSPSPDSGTWAGTSPEPQPLPTPMTVEEVTAPPAEQGAVESPAAAIGEGQGTATRGGAGALGARNEAAGSIPPGAGRGPDVAGAEDAALALGPMRQGQGRDADQHPEPGTSGLGESSGIDVAGTNATDEGAGASGEWR